MVAHVALDVKIDELRPMMVKTYFNWQKSKVVTIQGPKQHYVPVSLTNILTTFLKILLNYRRTRRVRYCYAYGVGM